MVELTEVWCNIQTTRYRCTAVSYVRQLLVNKEMFVRISDISLS